MDLPYFLTNAHLLCFDKRKAIWSTVESALAHLGIHTRRFVMGASDDHELVYDHIDRHAMQLPCRQRLNYCEAIQSLLRRELSDGKKHIFLSEDDNQLCSNSIELWPQIVEQAKSIPDDWQMLYLHSVRVHSQTTHHSPNILRMLDGCLGTRAVIMKQEAMRAIMGLRASPYKGIDGLIRDSVHPCLKGIYTVWPCVLRGDLDNWSYQENRHVLGEWLDDCVMNRGSCLAT